MLRTSSQNTSSETSVRKYPQLNRLDVNISKRFWRQKKWVELRLNIVQMQINQSTFRLIAGHNGLGNPSHRAYPNPIQETTTLNIIIVSKLAINNQYFFCYYQKCVTKNKSQSVKYQKFNIKQDKTKKNDLILDPSLNENITKRQNL